MAPKYKLTYFNTLGYTEHIRFIFAYANQEYEDVRLSQDEWAIIKPTTPFGKLPVLEFDGKCLSQSNAIARYLSKQFGLAGKNDWESLRCDELADSARDLRIGVTNIFYADNPEKKEELRKQFVEKDMPFYFKRFNKIAEDNGGYLVGSQVTWADFALAIILHDVESVKPGTLKSYPALESLLNRVHSYPGIKAWIEKRPANIFPFPI